MKNKKIEERPAESREKKTKMEKIAIYGKGGIGKSVVSTNLSAYFGKIGRKVLHVGCDPKHDSSLKLCHDSKIVTVLELLGNSTDVPDVSRCLNRGWQGVHCLEAGGPKPGVGCGGRGVAKTIEVINEARLLDPGRYDVAVFDVLGDVVCGGFAAPLRHGMAEKVFIVVSEEPMALFAANNIAKAVITYRDNGIVLGGLVANLRSGQADVGLIERFAERLSTRVVTVIHRNELIIEAEKQGRTVIEYAFDSPIAREFVALAETVGEIKADSAPLPTPIEDDEFFDFLRADHGR